MAIVRPSYGPISGAGSFGWRKIGTEPPTYHGGVDFVGGIGSPIRAVKAGVVQIAAPNGTYNRYGNLVVIKHDDPTEAPLSLYAHMNELKVRKWQRVRAGQLIGTMGNTSADRVNPNHKVATHLHFELLKAFPAPPDTGRIDPMPFLNPAFSPVASPVQPASSLPSTSYGQGPLLYSDYSYGQGPLRGLEATRWTSNTPWPFATAPGAGFAQTQLGDSLSTTVGGLFLALGLVGGYTAYRVSGRNKLGAAVGFVGLPLAYQMYVSARTKRKMLVRVAKEQASFEAYEKLHPGSTETFTLSDGKQYLRLKISSTSAQRNAYSVWARSQGLYA
jgi:hypothetical protein